MFVGLVWLTVITCLFWLNHPHDFWKCWYRPQFTWAISNFSKYSLGQFIPNRTLKYVITSTKYNLQLYFRKIKHSDVIMNDEIFFLKKNVIHPSHEKRAFILTMSIISLTLGLLFRPSFRQLYVIKIHSEKVVLIIYKNSIFLKIDLKYVNSEKKTENFGSDSFM